MASEDQLRILKTGVPEWNRWRSMYPEVKPLLRGADLRGVHLRGVDLKESNLCGVNFSAADLQKADLRAANLHGARLASADLRKAYMGEADLSAANLRDANLTGAFLTCTAFQRANLRHTNFNSALLGGANFENASFDQTYLTSNSLAKAEGLEHAEHKGPSILSHTTLRSAQGCLPDAFLRGIGLLEWEILSAKLHAPNLRPDEVIDITYKIADLRTKAPIQVNSLFISYSRVDSAFVEFLENKLKDDGIPSWRDSPDLIAGPIEPQIERAIKLNGTVLLVLSNNSLGSDWVEWEVRKARELHQDLLALGKNSHVLCPIAIDDSWKSSKWPGPLMNQLLKYNILDFSKWQNEEAVEGAYAQLKAGIAKYYSD